MRYTDCLMSQQNHEGNVTFLLFWKRRIVRGQPLADLDKHDPIKCAKLFEEWGQNPSCPEPQFAGNPPGVRGSFTQISDYKEVKCIYL